MKNIILLLLITVADAAPAQTATPDVIGFDSYGQSLGVGGTGGEAASIVSRVQGHDNIMFNLGVRIMSWNGSEPSAFAPLVETISRNTIMGETPCSGAADMFCEAMPYKPFQLFASASGQPNQSISSLSKGGPYYSRLLSAHHYADSLTATTNKTYKLGALFYTQGEADYTIATTQQDYRDKLDTLQSNVGTDIGYSVPVIIAQIASQNKHTAAINNPAIAQGK